jgi:GT2 family glycosyltransferase
VDNDDSIQPVVAALAQQTFSPARFEVLVMHPGTPIPAHLDAGELHLRQIDSGVYGGRAAAFNRGIREARADLVVLLAHDFVPCQGFLAAHLSAHESDPRPDFAAIGPAIFPPELRDSPFRRWLEDSGALFGVPFTSSQPPPPDFFWCANTSLKRRHLLADDLFDERLSLTAWDDYELGLRLRARGTEIRWVPEAMAIHEHPVTVAERRDVMQDAGISAARFDAKYPRAHAWHSGTDPNTPSLRTEAMAQWARLRHALSHRESDAHTYFEKTLRAAFLRGYRQELRRLGALLDAVP